MQILPTLDEKDVHILLLDPAGPDHSQVCRLLSSEGMDVVCRQSAETMLEVLEAHCRERRVDMVICCTLQRGMSAGQFVRRAKATPAMQDVPVLMLTEDTSPRVELDCFECGADAYLSSSAHSDLLLMRIRTMLHLAEEKRLLHPQWHARRARVVIVRAPEDEALLDFWNDPHINSYDRASEGAEDAGLGELLWRDGHTVTSVTRSSDLLNGSWLTGTDGPDCIVLEDIRDNEADLAFCRLLDQRRHALRAQGGIPFRILGIIQAERFRGESCVAFLETGLEDLVPSDMTPMVLALRIRAMVRRRRENEAFRQREMERQQSALALEAAQAQASLADALARANRELAQMNEELVQTQARLVQTAKMASLGELVAGIAHEINNPLAFTLGHADTVERCLRWVETTGQGEEGQARIERAMTRLAAMKTGLGRIRDLVVRLRRFSRLEEGHWCEVDAGEAIEMGLALVSHRLSRDITVECQLEAPRQLVCQETLFHQAVMNLIANAADALNDARQDGQLQRKGLIRIATRLYDDVYEITVSDNGPGINEAIRPWIFDPFFTTKAQGEGTGLGLSIVHGIVQAHGGTIDITDACGAGKSWPEEKQAGAGRGAHFVIRLPVYRAAEGWAVREPKRRRAQEEMKQHERALQYQGPTLRSSGG
ncbi:hybrid sensor histidine kinase/response regulator [Bombella sp. TMW 2.2559]|uniref:histidine kinase n=1 Tax=Bombella dulcis TaxID=2967339 RepID=A0ABT3WIH6_9PROT|nr:hybrid sensor histidine kinase/response regulator [Bombella dulcis]MCX5616646.1 hybrid sensor histidine kinase/response regulator [Bombella dulcis]